MIPRPITATLHLRISSSLEINPQAWFLPFQSSPTIAALKHFRGIDRYCSMEQPSSYQE
jgi:hypothetical protein